MKKTNLSVSIYLMVLLIVGISNAQSQTPDTLNGVIEEYEIDNDGEVKSVVFNILDADFNTVSYVVENNAKGKELYELIGQNIDIIGILKVNTDGSRSITVLEYSVPEEDDYLPPDDFGE